MVGKPEKNLEQMVAEDGRYMVEVFRFVRDGLSHAVERVHGAASDQLMQLFQYLQDNDLELSDLIHAYEDGEIDPRLGKAVEAAGGIEKFNRHVNGQELCWGLRDLALRTWGMLARVVLRRWGVKKTRDFGEIVFAMIEGGFMQRQPHDSIEDFDDVFEFREAFDDYRFPGPGNGNGGE